MILIGLKSFMLQPKIDKGIVPTRGASETI